MASNRKTSQCKSLLQSNKINIEEISIINKLRNLKYDENGKPFNKFFLVPLGGGVGGVY